MVLVEQFVDGVEFAITVLETTHSSTHTRAPESMHDPLARQVTTDHPVALALPAVEISPPGAVFDYESRYTAGMTTYFTPARLTDEVAAAAADLAFGAHRALGLRDLSRTDAIATEDGSVHFLEVNVSPGLTETSMLPMSVAARDSTWARSIPTWWSGR